MNTARKIAKNTTVILISQIFTYILGFFTTLATLRYLGPSNYGILYTALSITGILGVIADMGLSTLMIREVARDKSLKNKYVSNIAVMKLILAFITFGVMTLTVTVLGYNTIIVFVTYIITLSVIISGFGGFLSAIFQANEKMEYISLNTILNSVLMLIGTLLVIHYNLNVIYFAYIYLAAGIVTIFYFSISYLRKFSLPQIEIDFSFWKQAIKEAWSFGITGLSGMLYTYIDSIMLSVMIGTEVVGWYRAAYNLILITLFVPNAINAATFPVMSRFYDSSKDSLTLMHERYFKYMVILGIPMGVGITLLADKIMLLLGGSGYIQSIIALQILIWTMVLTFIGASFVQLLQSINKQLIITKISIICVIFNIALNLVIIPKYSYIGASVVTVLTEILLVGYIIWTSYKLGYGIHFKVVVDSVSKTLFATLIMSVLIWYLKDLNLFILIILATLLYFITLYLIKGVDDKDILIVKEILNKNK